MCSASSQKYTKWCKITLPYNALCKQKAIKKVTAMGQKKTKLIQSGAHHIFHKSLLGLESVSNYQHKPIHIRKHHLFHLSTRQFPNYWHFMFTIVVRD